MSEIERFMRDTDNLENSAYLGDKDTSYWDYKVADKNGDRRRKLWGAYGMTPAEYAELLNDQKGVCAICGGNSGEKRLSVDHCHDTQRIRGLLCTRCNSILGFAKDEKAVLRNAIEYLQE